jgi:polyhydroxybutyrate depolymerase
VPDVEFMADLITTVESDFCIDPKRIFSAGFSNGGMLSHRLACELSERIAAIGPVAGTMAIDSCSPTRPVPVMHTHGTSDFVVLWDGGGFGNASSVDDTIEGWVSRNGCDGTPKSVYQNGDASCSSYGPCAAGSDVRLCTIDGGGHQWPGGQSIGPTGHLSEDLDTSTTLIDFFEAHPLP